MHYLPLKSVWPSEDYQFGDEIINLAKITHLNIPVPEGLVILPPTSDVLKIVGNSKLNQEDPEKLAKIRKEFLKLEIPKDLRKELSKKKVNINRLWSNLVNSWFLQLLNSRKLDQMSSLRPRVIFFTNNINSLGQVHYDSAVKDSVVKIQKGQLSPRQLKELDSYATRLKNGLVFHYFFDWIVDDGIKFVNVRHAVDTPELILIQKSAQTIAPRQNLVTKLFHRQKNYVSATFSDGMLINGEDFLDSNEKRFILCETASSFPNLPVIYRLTDQKDQFGTGSGSYRLLHDLNKLEREVEVFLYAFNNKSLKNCQLGLPTVRSTQELGKLKKQLFVTGLARGPIKLWLEIGYPINILEFEDFLNEGIDGVLLNVKTLAAWLGGYDPSSDDISSSTLVLTSFNTQLKHFFTLAKRSNLPILVIGGNYLHDDLLKMLVNSGIYGVVSEISEMEGLKNQLGYLEKKLFLG